MNNIIRGPFWNNNLPSPETIWFNALIDKYYRAVLSGFASCLGSSDPGILEQLSIDCFVALWHLREGIYPAVNISSILTRLIFEQALNYLSKNGLHEQIARMGSITYNPTLISPLGNECTEEGPL